MRIVDFRFLCKFGFNVRNEAQSNWGGQMNNMVNGIRSGWNWKIYAYLLVLYILGFAAGIPFVLSFQEYATTGEVVVDGLKGFFIGVAVLTLGSLLTTQTGLGTPYLENWLSRKPRVISIRLVLFHSVFVVIGTSFVLFFLRILLQLLAIACGGIHA